MLQVVVSDVHVKGGVIDEKQDVGGFEAGIDQKHKHLEAAQHVARLYGVIQVHHVVHKNQGEVT